MLKKIYNINNDNFFHKQISTRTRLGITIQNIVFKEKKVLGSENFEFKKTLNVI